MKTKLFLNKYYFFFLLFFTIFIISSCSSDEPVKPEEKKKSNFGIYLLTDQSITWESIQGRNLDSLKLTAWITSDMIDSMDYSSQVFYLNVNYNTLLAFPHNDNTPFVVVANDKRCYTGRFGPPKDTTQPCVTFTPMALCTDLVMLEFNPPQRKDIRNNDEVKSALTSLGKLKPGINLPLTGIKRYDSFRPQCDTLVPPMYVTSVYCTNYENDWIYTKGFGWDIIKAGNKTYQTKLVFYNQSSYYCFLPIIPPFDTIKYKTPHILDPEKGYFYGYFLPFKKGEDRSFSSSSGTAHYLPAEFKNGVYYCYEEFYGGMMGGDKNQRYTPKGRMYMGYLRSNTIQVEYDSTKKFTTLNVNVVLP